MSCCNEVNIDCLSQGDDLRVWVPVFDEKGQEVDITDAQAIEYRLFRNYGQPVVIAKSLGSGISISGQSNQFYFDLESAETEPLSPGAYRHEAWLVTAGGLEYTGLRGRVRVLPSRKVD